MNSLTNNKCIVFNIPFNNLKPLPHVNVATDANWIKRRMAIFMNYTLKSLKAQSCQNFIACVLYNPSTQAIILDELTHYPSLPANILFMSGTTAYDNYISNYIKGSTYFYEVEMASDNMYHRNFVSYLFEYIHVPSTKILICQNGYIYSSVTHDLAEYFNYSNCFNCKVYNTLHYEQGVRHSYTGFEGAILLPHEKIPWRTYIAHAHADNIAFNYGKETHTPWGYDKAHLGTLITSSHEKNRILSEFMDSSSTEPPLKDKCIVFNIPLNNLDPLTKVHVALDPEWIEKRIEIFMNYTLKSLKAQTAQDFMAYILYNPATEAIILNHVSRYPELPSNIRFVSADLYTQHVNAYIKESDYLYEVELASDDLYHCDFVAYLKGYKPQPTTCILICQEGYIYSSITGELAYYFNHSSSFNCYIYSTQAFLKGLRHYYNGFEGAINLPHEIIPWRAYINHSHANNIAFSYTEEQRNPWGKTKAHLGPPITNSLEKQNILAQFTGAQTAFKHIFRIKFNVSYAQFNNPFLEVRLTKEWMAYRLSVFMKYTYPSLLKQTDQNFIVLIAYDILSEPILKELLEAYPPLAPNIIFTPDMPGEIKKLIVNTQYVIFTYWDSDNILHSDLVRKIHQVDLSKHQAVINQNGYVYDLARHILGCYSHQAPDTFYSVIYKAKEYYDGFRYPFSANSYEEFITGFPCLSLNPYTLTERNFLILIHNKNISHVIENMLRMRSVTHLLDNTEECTSILKEFGCLSE